jgi:hypothetical protein
MAPPRFEGVAEPRVLEVPATWWFILDIRPEGFGWNF